MSTPEKAGTSAVEVIYDDGSVVKAERIDSPGILLRTERAYPDFDPATETGRRLEHGLFMIYTALLRDHPPGDPLRPGDDLQTWADTVMDFNEVDPTPAPIEAPPAAVRPFAQGVAESR